MGKNNSESSPSRALAAKTVYATFKYLKERGGQAPSKEVIDELSQRLTFNEWENHRYERTGYVRWQSILHFFTIDCNKAGYLLKKKGIWYLTPEGEKAIELGEKELLDSATAAYKTWRIANPKVETDVDERVENEELTGDENAEFTLDEMEVRASEGIKKYIDSINAYEFQDLVAALLRGMGYHTPFIAPKGKDGGIDVIAYRDPLGTVIPRIKVQVKHRENSASAGEVRQLIGILQKDGDVGLFVSTGGFSPDAKGVARGASIHVELIDLDRFIELWQEFYHKLSDEDKNRLPLLPIYFLAPSE